MKHVSPEVFVGPVTKELMDGRIRVELGWCQGRFVDERGFVCALGALGRRAESTRMFATELYLKKALPVANCVVVEYNDEPGRTKADILALYDRAIELAKRDGL